MLFDRNTEQLGQLFCDARGAEQLGQLFYSTAVPGLKALRA
jgi:hypothetical protein